MEKKELATPKAIDEGKVLQRIAFGSCSHQYDPQPIWQPIVANQPDLWIWLGDVVYADTENMNVMRQKYRQQREHPDYQKLLDHCPIIGTWDDHDYGANNSGKHYPKKEGSEKIFEEFFSSGKDHPASSYPGIYHSFTFGEVSRQVKVILLDCRYFRDDRPADNDQQARQAADILGEAQWQWLEKELKNSQAQIHIIASGIQVVPEEHRFEKWANFPTARQRLFDLLVQYEVKNGLLISGDRHIGEISQYDLTNGDQITEITSSGLTHSYEKAKNEPNRYRKGNLVNQLNFGLLEIDWQDKQPTLKASIKGMDNVLYEEIVLSL
ncbi:MAG: alkaline phosphatase D family protein [Bacteroidota bacterium]